MSDKKRDPNWNPPRCEVKSENVPQMLRELPRWILWRWEWRKNKSENAARQGAWNKTPRQADGNHAASNDPRTWATFEEVILAHDLGDFSGIGIVLPKTVVGVDLDDCKLRNGDITEEAQIVLASMHTYAEWSPSGDGLKMIAGGRLAKELKSVDKKRGVELYDGGNTNRYFAITGDVIDKNHSEITAQREGLDILQGWISDPIADSYVDEDYEPELGDIGIAVKCLNHLSSDYYEEYDLWSAVGMALKSVDTSEDMFLAWSAWSSQGSKYDGEDSCRMKWDSYKRERGRLITLSWLKREAKKCGWNPDRYSTGAVSAVALCSQVIERDYIIENVLVAGEPGVIGGSSKALKTTVACEQAISIATGKKFLDTFKVDRPRKVMMISGESGAATLQETINAISAHKGISTDELFRLEIGFNLPKLDDISQVMDLLEEMKAKEIEVLYIDPLYRSLRAGQDASNVYAMGERLELIAELINPTGITLQLLHHFKKQGKTYGEAPELEDLSQSGIAEFCRQFFLLKRMAEYQYDGKHELWTVWGGSAGHQGMKVLRADTGTREAGIHWNPYLLTLDEWKAEQRGKKEADKAVAEIGVEEKVLAVLTDHNELSLSKLQDICGGRKDNIKRAAERLVARGEVAEESGPRNARLFSIPIEGEDLI